MISNGSHSIVNANDVIGVSVENHEHEGLGKIEALMLHKISGKVVYVVLKFNDSLAGILGIGNKLFAMPWSMFSYSKDRNGFIINVNKEVLKNSPGFDADHWPDMSDKKWSEGIYNYYGVQIKEEDLF